MNIYRVKNKLIVRLSAIFSDMYQFKYLYTISCSNNRIIRSESIFYSILIYHYIIFYILNQYLNLNFILLPKKIYLIQFF